jgi:exodeoxyribonuclease-3
MRFISWNVNGIRSVLNKGFNEFIKKYQPDVLCLQETKTPAGDTFRLKIDSYEEYWNNAKKPGYAGTAILSKIKPIKVTKGIDIPKHDDEGRVLTAEFKDLYLVNVYVPNSQRTLDRLPYRTKEWDVDFLKYLKKLEKKKPVVFCGDLNVAHKEIDLTYPKANVKNHGFTPEERAGFDAIVAAGFLDTFREREKGEGHYTWWSQFNNCRKRNIGWRIDYFCMSPSLKSRLVESRILKEVMGSDHCPIELELK